MTTLHALLLGLLQGLTEFLPISSSGHLALLENLMDVPMTPRDLLGFDIMLHAGSVIALFACYAALWIRMGLSLFNGDREPRRLLGLLVLASIPAATAGYFLEDLFAAHFRSLTSLAAQFAITGVILIVAERTVQRHTIATLRVFPALAIGVAQAFALVPALSRSGLTIAAGRAAGLRREDAVHFSFLMALPVIAGAALHTLLQVYDGTVTLPPISVTFVGFAASLVASVAAIIFLKLLAKKFSMAWFAVYLFILAAAILAWQFHLESIGDPAVIERAVKTYGAAVLFLFALIETIPPLSFFSPGVLALVIGGALAKNPLTWILFGAAAVLGIIVGNTLFFLLGERYGHRIAHRFHLTPARLHATEMFMRRFGRLGIFAAQFVGAARPVAAFLAGSASLPRRIFYPSMIVGAAIFVALLLGAGALTADYIAWTLSIVGLSGVLIVLVALLIIALFQRRGLTRTKK